MTVSFLGFTQEHLFIHVQDLSRPILTINKRWTKMRKRKTQVQWSLHRFKSKTIDNRLAFSRCLCGARTKYKTADPRVSGSNPSSDINLQTRHFMATVALDILTNWTQGIDDTLTHSGTMGTITHDRHMTTNVWNQWSCIVWLGECVLEVSDRLPRWEVYRVSWARHHMAIPWSSGGQETMHVTVWWVQGWNHTV